MAIEHPLSKIPIEKFVEEHALELYQAEKKRQAYRKSLWIFIPSVLFALLFYFLMNIILPSGIAFGFIIPLLGVVGGITIYFNTANKDFRNNYKQTILPLFFKSYYPKLEFKYLLGNPKSLIVVEQEEHRRYSILQKEDHIKGSIGRFQVEIYEGLVSGYRTGTPYEEGSLVAEISGVNLIDLENHLKKTAVQKAIQDLYKQFLDYPKIFEARHGKFYVILNLRQKYLEPNVKKKVYDLEYLKETLEEMHNLIGLIELLEASWQGRI